MRLSETLGQTISDFCRNGFTASNENHCAHFVCHVLEVDTGYDCRTHTGRNHPGACIRVQELFAECPQVGWFEDAPSVPCIAFVTAKSNVDLEAHTMRNVPQKHVGIYDGTHIYHYSNTRDIVVRQKPEEFLERFQAIYSGDQGLFYGTMPPSAVLPEPEDGVAAVAHATAAEVPESPAVAIRPQTIGGRTHYFARVAGGDEFYVGRDVGYLGNRGLDQPESRLYGPVYEPSAYMERFGPPAAIVGVIAEGESKRHFNRLNSYDRAAFTFGFFQLAAHTPNDNLILLFRLLAREHAGFQALFPDLSVRNGVLQRQVGDNHFVTLETQYLRPGSTTEMNLRDFMSYLNESLTRVDDRELKAAARLMHLANTDAESNTLQVKMAVEITMHKMRNRYAAWYGLDGESDLVCTAIADIHHQGRGTLTQVRAALQASTTVAKLTALCRIGEDNYASRCETLRLALRRAQQNGLLGTSVFDRASGLFRPATGWVA